MALGTNNTNAPKGLTLVDSMVGGKPRINMYFVPSTDGTAIFIGDPVTLGGTAGAAGTVVNGIDVEGMPTVKQNTTVSTPVGVAVAFLPKQSDLSVKHREASTARIVLVSDDPEAIYEIQEDSLVSVLAAADIGEGVDIIIGTGSATTGLSQAMIDSSSHATTGKTLRILRLAPRVDNTMGDGTVTGATATLYAKWLVTFAEHQYKSADGL